MPLSDQQCIPCKVGAPTLTPKEITFYLRKVNKNWTHTPNPDKITRTFEFKDFSEAIKFVNKVAKLAEKQNHHPNILVFNFNNVQLEIWTHKINGLHKNDFILASKIDSISKHQTP